MSQAAPFAQSARAAVSYDAGRRSHWPSAKRPVSPTSQHGLCEPAANARLKGERRVQPPVGVQRAGCGDAHARARQPVEEVPHCSGREPDVRIDDEQRALWSRVLGDRVDAGRIPQVVAELQDLDTKAGAYARSDLDGVIGRSIVSDDYAV